MGTIYYSVQDGDWLSPYTWSPNGVPGLYAPGDVAVIRHRIDIDTTRMGGIGGTWYWSLPYRLSGIIFDKHPTEALYGTVHVLTPTYYYDLPSPQGAIVTIPIMANPPGLGIQLDYEKGIEPNIFLFTINYPPLGYSPPPSGIPKPYVKFYLDFYVDGDMLTPISYPIVVDTNDPPRVTMQAFLPSAKLIEIIGRRPSSPTPTPQFPVVLFHLYANSLLCIRVKMNSGTMSRCFYAHGPGQNVEYYLIPNIEMKYSPPQTYSTSEDRVHAQVERKVTTIFPLSSLEKVKLQHRAPQLQQMSNSPLSTSDTLSIASTFNKRDVYTLGTQEDVTLHFPQENSPTSYSHSISVSDIINGVWYYPPVDESQAAEGVERVMLDVSQQTNTESSGEELSSVVFGVATNHQQSNDILSGEDVSVDLVVTTSQEIGYSISTKYHPTYKVEVSDNSIQEERVSLSPQITNTVSSNNIYYDEKVEIALLAASTTIVPSIELVRLPHLCKVMDTGTFSESTESIVVLFDNLEILSNSPLVFHEKVIFPSIEEETHDYMDFRDKGSVSVGQIWSVASLSPLVSKDKATISVNLPSYTEGGEMDYTDKVNLAAMSASFYLHSTGLGAQTSVLLEKVIEQSETYTIVFSSSVLWDIYLRM